MVSGASFLYGKNQLFLVDGMASLLPYYFTLQQFAHLLYVFGMVLYLGTQNIVYLFYQTLINIYIIQHLLPQFFVNNVFQSILSTRLFKERKFKNRKVRIQPVFLHTGYTFIQNLLILNLIFPLLLHIFPFQIYQIHFW